MTGKETALLETIARAMPVLKMEYGRVDLPIGTVYMAFGRLANWEWQGVWGHRGVARLCEFGANATELQVKQLLLNDAAEYAEMAGQRHMYDEGFWRGGRA